MYILTEFTDDGEDGRSSNIFIHDCYDIIKNKEKEWVFEMCKQINFKYSIDEPIEDIITRITTYSNVEYSINIIDCDKSIGTIYDLTEMR
jgi:hypothetical protein